MDFHKFQTLIHEIKCMESNISALDLFITLYRRVHELSFCEDDINRKALLLGKSFVSLFKLADKLQITSILDLQVYTFIREAIEEVDSKGVTQGKNDLALFVLVKLAKLGISIKELDVEKTNISYSLHTALTFKPIEGLLVGLCTYAIKNDIDINDSIEKAMIRKEEV